MEIMFEENVKITVRGKFMREQESIVSVNVIGQIRFKSMFGM